MTQLTKFMVAEKPLDLTNEPLKRICPHSPSGSKKAEKMRKMHRHVMVWPNCCMWMDINQLRDVRDHALEVHLRAKL